MQYVLLLWLAVLSSCAILTKLTSLRSTPLTPHDYLVSTLGRFRLTLVPTTCQLQLQNFTHAHYSIVGYYPRAALPSCSSARLVSNALVSDNQQRLLAMRTPHLSASFDEVYMTIDEMGIVRLNGVFGNQFVTAENWISIFRTPQEYLFSISNLNVNSIHSLSFIENRGRWGFSATNGELRIFKVDNVSRIAKYNYTAFTITPNNLFDRNSNSLPQAYFPFFKYRPLCPANSFRSFQGPFVFQISPYWPQIRLLDRTGYEIIAIRYPGRSCPTHRNTYQLDGRDECFDWFCPEGTFEFEGSCRATCPAPYFHQVSQDGTHRCVLNCMEGLTRDIENRVCACGLAAMKECPPSTTPTPLGCLCPSGQFYNPYNNDHSSAQLACTQTCGPFLFTFHEGICVPCPRFCMTCVRSNSSYGYLKCSRCQEGYQLQQKFYCVKKCNTATPSTQLALQSTLIFLSQECPTCNSNCEQCSQDGTCLACLKPYSLYLGRCFVQCPRGHICKTDSSYHFTCQIVDACDPNSPTTVGTNNQSTCYCLANNLPTYEYECGSKTSQLCGISQYFNSPTKECLQCPLGCLTCSLDASSRIECTSCRPQYNMFVTLFQQSYCERKSILTNCPQTYDPRSQLCSLNGLQTAVATSPARNQCLQREPNCALCLTGSSVSCSICSEGLYLYIGRCFTQCPSKTYPYHYQRVCIPATLPNCLKEDIFNQFWLFELNQQTKRADAYYYMLTVNFRNTDLLNDPRGVPFHYDKDHTAPIQVSIATSQPKCTQCQEGYGITIEGKCSKCTFPCQLCVFVAEGSNHCSRCNHFYRLSEQGQCVKLSRTQMPCLQGQFRNESLICQDQCQGFVRHNNQVQESNTTYQVNCTLNCPSGLGIASANSQLQCSNTAQSAISETIQFLGSRVELASGVLLMLISPSPLVYTSSSPARVETLSPAQSRRLQTDSPRVQSTQVGIVIHSATSDDPLLVYLQSANIHIDEDGQPVYPGNSVYGFDSNSKSAIDIIYDDTYNLYMYGRAYVILTIIVTVIFLSRQINYKTDNLFIIFAVVYLILPSTNLQASQSAFNSYSFTYGFAWSTFLEMLSHPRFVTSSTSWFEDGYLQRVPNNAHYLLFVDNNILRNGWSILLMLIVVIGVLGIAIMIMKACAVNKIKHGDSRWSRVGYSSMDVDHTRSVSYFLLFCVQTSFIGFTYYSFINLFNESWALAPASQNTGFKIMAVVFLVSMLAFSLLRFYLNRIGGIYCFKRMALGIVLGAVSELGGIDANTAVAIVLLVLTQIGFTALRYKYELLTNPLGAWLCKKKKFELAQPRTRIRRGQTLTERAPELTSFATEPRKSSVQTDEPQIPQWGEFWTIVVEEFLIIVLYIFAGLLPTLHEVSVLMIWLIINVFMVVMALQLLELAVDYWDRSVNHHSDSQKGFVRPLRSVWDHDVTVKSLTTNDN